MGRGRLGGTKSKIRGKVGSEVYQMKRDPNGTLLQTVYAMPENPTYTNTEKQAKNRCIMGQIDRMWHWLPQIIKDSFANVERGALSFQMFSRLNYPLLKSDYLSHYESEPDFDWQVKGELHAPAGPWLLTHGTLPAVAWSDAHFSLGWNNGLVLEWNNLESYETYGDFLDCFGLQHGDRLVFVVFRQDFRATWGYVETWSFWPRQDYPRDLPWRNVDDENVFRTNCPYIVLAGQNSRKSQFYFSIDTQNFPSQIKIACFTFFVVRPSENGTLFSSSKFTWAQGNVAGGYLRHSPSQVWSSWFND